MTKELKVTATADDKSFDLPSRITSIDIEPTYNSNIHQRLGTVDAWDITWKIEGHIRVSTNMVKQLTGLLTEIYDNSL